MKVIIPAAGFGSRLKPHTFTVPKSLFQVGGKPIIGHILDQVIEWGGSRFTFIVGHLHENLETYIKGHYDAPMEFRRQDKILGLAHAVLTGLDPDDKELLIILGDTILNADLKPVIERGLTSIGVKEVADARKFGVVELDGKRVTRLTEKSPEPPSNLAIVGVYYIRDGAMLGRAIKELIEQGTTVKGEYQLTDALQMMLDWGEEIETFPISGWFDCGKPETLLETNRYILDRDGGSYSASCVLNSVIIPPVYISIDALIENSIIGPYAVVGPKTVIRRSVISDSIIAGSCTIEHAVLSESLIGHRCKIRTSHSKINLGASGELEL